MFIGVYPGNSLEMLSGSVVAKVSLRSGLSSQKVSIDSRELNNYLAKVTHFRTRLEDGAPLLTMLARHIA